MKVEEQPEILSPCLNIKQRRSNTETFSVMQFYKNATSITIMKCFSFASNMIAMHFISTYGNKYLTAGFGLAICFYNLLNFILTNLNSETCGLKLNKF